MDIDTLMEKLKSIKESYTGNEKQIVRINTRYTMSDGRQLWYLSEVQDVYLINDGKVIFDALN